MLLFPQRGGCSQMRPSRTRSKTREPGRRRAEGGGQCPASRCTCSVWIKVAAYFCCSHKWARARQLQAGEMLAGCSRRSLPRGQPSRPGVAGAGRALPAPLLLLSCVPCRASAAWRSCCPRPPAAGPRGFPRLSPPCSALTAGAPRALGAGPPCTHRLWGSCSPSPGPCTALPPAFPDLPAA